MKNEIIEIERRMLENQARIVDLEHQIKASKRQDKSLVYAAIACYSGLLAYAFWPEIAAFVSSIA